MTKKRYLYGRNSLKREQREIPGHWLGFAKQEEDLTKYVIVITFVFLILIKNEPN